MKRYFFLICALCALLYGQQNTNIFDLSADDVKARNDEVIAEGNAFLLYNDVYMVANKIIYNKQSKEAHLQGGVKI